MGAYVCAVDVGTRSARAALYDLRGRRFGHEEEPFALHETGSGVAEYASDEIWAAIARAVRRLVAASRVAPERIGGLGFDATCSLVLSAADGTPLALGEGGRDTIAWCDHRAAEEARACSATGHRMIAHLGGAMSPEMQTPKLLWLKRQRPDLWERLGRAADLTDHLATRATGHTVFSACTMAAKWAYLAQSGGWQQDFLDEIGLADLLSRTRLPPAPDAPGSRAGPLSVGAARMLGLVPGTPVAVGLIDAYAGALGGLGLAAETERPLALIAGTSACLMAQTTVPLQVPGIWGPFRDAVLPGRFVCEGGQSAAGALLDFILDSWPGRGSAPRPDHDQVLARIGERLAEDGPGFGANLLVLPDFLGNRSPLGDAAAGGVIAGMRLDRSFDGLCALYWRSAVALAIGMRQILDHMEQGGIGAGLLVMSGGLSRSRRLAQLFADAADRPLRFAPEADGVLRGTAIAASVAARFHPNLQTAARAMAAPAETLTPDQAWRRQIDRDRSLFATLQGQRSQLERLLNRPF